MRIGRVRHGGAVDQPHEEARIWQSDVRAAQILSVGRGQARLLHVERIIRPRNDWRAGQLVIAPFEPGFICVSIARMREAGLYCRLSRCGNASSNRRSQ